MTLAALSAQNEGRLPHVGGLGLGYLVAWGGSGIHVDLDHACFINIDSIGYMVDDVHGHSDPLMVYRGTPLP